MGSVLKISREQLLDIISNSRSYRQAADKLGININSGHYVNDLKKLIGYHNITEKDFVSYKGQSWNRGEVLYDFDEIFRQDTKASNYRIKQILLICKLKQNKCECCGSVSWMGIDLCLELHHINGNNKDARIENLQLLCPNCHSITQNYRRFKDNHIQIDDEQLIESIKKSHNSKQALENVGLVGKGGNYVRVKRLIVEHNISFMEKPDKIIDCDKNRKSSFIKTKTCPICSCNFETNKKEQVYCSQECWHNNSMKFDPSKDELLELLKSGVPMTKIGEAYGVSDNAVRKRLKKFGIHQSDSMSW